MWYWGWFERKEGKIPCLDGEGVSGPIPIRRFLCPKCGRTFSWRPRFLIFKRPLAAVAYQRALKPSRPVDAACDAGSWYQMDDAARKALRQLVLGSAYYLLRRLKEGLKLTGSCSSSEERSSPPRAISSSKEETRNALWYLARRVARVFSKREEQPRLAVHYLLIALARHSSGVRYSLEYT